MDAKKLFKMPPFKPELYLKKTIASSFWKDSNDFLWRVKVFDKDIHDTLSVKAKNYVDLIMAIECSLKSLIISLSKRTETPEDAYLIARKHSHNLVKLYEETKKRAKNRVKLLNIRNEKILIKANSLGVGQRYHVTAFLFLSQEDWIERSSQLGSISSIINRDFLRQLDLVAHELNKKASNTLSEQLGWYARVNLPRYQEIIDRQNLFITNMGKKL